MDYLIWIFLGLVILFGVLKLIQLRRRAKQAENCFRKNTCNACDKREGCVGCELISNKIEVAPAETKDLFDR